jgi:polar amino acid transport system substrate-binding protein
MLWDGYFANFTPNPIQERTDMTIKLRFFALFLSLAFGLAPFLGTSASQAAGEIQKIKDAGKVRIAVYSDQSPFGYLDADGQPAGYDVWLAKRIGQDLLGDESKIEWVYTPTNTRMEILQSDKADILLANFTKTAKRAEQVDFARPYLKVSTGVISPKSAPITDVSELKGKRLIVRNSTFQASYFAENHPEIELVKLDGIPECLQALLDGRGEALSMDNTLVFALEKQNPDLAVGIRAMGPDATINPAVKKGNAELLEWINQEIAKLESEKFFLKAYDATLGLAFGDSSDPGLFLVEE